jgi:hypothetical protein
MMGEYGLSVTLGPIFIPVTLFCGKLKLRHALRHAHLVLASSVAHETRNSDVGALSEEHANPNVARKSQLHFWMSCAVCRCFVRISNIEVEACDI